MTIQVQYEVNPNSELVNKEARYQARLKWYEMQLRGAQKWINDIVVPPPPNLKYPDYVTERGIFTFDLADIQTLMELIERNDARLQIGRFVQPMRPDWNKEWPFTPTEYYVRIRSELSVIQSSAVFDWKMFEPVYSLDRDEEIGIAGLAAWLLEQGQGACWCKACQQEYRAVELEIYDWKGNEIDGSMYLCPQDHVLLRTEYWYLGAIAIFSTERRTKRERRPNPASQEP